MNANEIKIGDVVGAEYRVYENKPYTGIVLAINDTRSWVGRLAFGYRQDIQQEEVDRHVKRCKELGLKLDDEVPVLWDFGKVHWENIDRLYRLVRSMGIIK